MVNDDEVKELPTSPAPGGLDLEDEKSKRSKKLSIPYGEELDPEESRRGLELPILDDLELSLEDSKKGPSLQLPSLDGLELDCDDSRHGSALPKLRDTRSEKSEQTSFGSFYGYRNPESALLSALNDASPQSTSTVARRRPSEQLDLGDEVSPLPVGSLHDFDASFGYGFACGAGESVRSAQLPDYSVSKTRRATQETCDRYSDVPMPTQISLCKFNRLMQRVNDICRGAGVTKAANPIDVDLNTCNLNELLDTLSDQLQAVDRKNYLNAIKRAQNSWYAPGIGARVPDRQVFDNVSVHLKTKYDEFTPQTGLSPVQTSAGGLYNGSPVHLRWEILDLIGSGASGKVYRAQSKVLPGEFAAVKIIDKSSRDYSERKVCREVYCFHIIQRAGGHENVVEVYEVDEDRQNVYIVMELLEGDHLLNRVSVAGTYRENNAVAIVSHVLEALAFVHSLNIIHRDVKAENFVFADKDPSSPIKLIDFGISHYSHEYGCVRGTELIGSALYVAPEMWRREEYGQEVDMFSLGILVHILMTGSPPFPGKDLNEYVKMIQEEEVVLTNGQWEMVSLQGRHFVSCLLDKNPSCRLSSRSALEHPWLRLFEEAPEQSVSLCAAQRNLKEFFSHKGFPDTQGISVHGREVTPSDVVHDKGGIVKAIHEVSLKAAKGGGPT